MWPTLMGYLRIVTHPSICRSPLPFEAARANVDGPLALPHIRAAGETAEFWRAFGPVSADVHLRGNLVPDTHLIALIRTHAVSHLWTRARPLRQSTGIPDPPP